MATLGRGKLELLQGNRMKFHQVLDLHTYVSRTDFFFFIVSKNLTCTVVSSSSNLILSHFQGQQKSCSLSALLPRHPEELEAGCGPGVLVGVAGCEEGLSRSRARRARVNILSFGGLAVSLKNERERGWVRANTTLDLPLCLSLESSSTCVWVSLSLQWCC